MPVTCFRRVAGASRCAWLVSLHRSQRRGAKRRASQRFAAICMHWWAKMRTTRTLTAAGAGVLHSCAALELSLLVSYTTLVSYTPPTKKRSMQGDGKPSIRK